MVVLAVPNMSIAMKCGGMRGRELKTMFFSQKKEALVNAKHREKNHISKTFHFRKCFRNPGFTIPVSFLAGFLTLNLMYSC